MFFFILLILVRVALGQILADANLRFYPCRSNVVLKYYYSAEFNGEFRINYQVEN